MQNGCVIIVLSCAALVISTPAPPGMSLNSATYQSNCVATRGCWVLNVNFGVGYSGAADGYSTFYLPRAMGSDAVQSYAYTDDVLETFSTGSFPCTGASTLCCFGTDFVVSTAEPSSSPNADAGAGTFFLGRYRTTEAFSEFAGNMSLCPDGSAANTTQPSTDIVNGFISEGQKFRGMSSSEITSHTTVDAELGIHTAEIRLDEVEVRQKAGLFEGVVANEFKVDFFLGFANFRPTGTTVLDSIASQSDIRVWVNAAPTRGFPGFHAIWFSNSIGANIIHSSLNLRLLSVEDVSGGLAAHLVQVTFEVGSEYDLKPLISDSVRTGMGTSADIAEMESKCVQWEAQDGSFGSQAAFQQRLQCNGVPEIFTDVCKGQVTDSLAAYYFPLGMGALNASSGPNLYISFVIEGTRKDNTQTGVMQVKATFNAVITVEDSVLSTFSCSEERPEGTTSTAGDPTVTTTEPMVETTEEPMLETTEEPMLETTPAPLKLEASTTLAGMTLALFDASAEETFREEVGGLLGRAKEDVVVTGKDEVARRRRLLESGLKVDYEVFGFDSQAALDAAASTLVSKGETLAEALKEDPKFSTLTSVSSTAANVDIADPDTSPASRAAWPVWWVSALGFMASQSVRLIRGMTVGL